MIHTIAKEFDFVSKHGARGALGGLSDLGVREFAGADKPLLAPDTVSRQSLIAA